jgi:D-arabinose 1-dehydrogenase-like Zn-dependent alcohol dehydrogenase
VLVYGASSAVGTAAIQLAKGFGARVTAVCGPKNIELVRSLGADESGPAGVRADYQGERAHSWLLQSPKSPHSDVKLQWPQAWFSQMP